MLIKVLAIGFALLGLRRVAARYKRGGSLTAELLLWSMIWSGIGLVVFIPHLTDDFARMIGVSTGFNALTFISVAGLLFAVFRLYSHVQRLQQDMTLLVRARAMESAVEIDTPKALTP